MRLAFMVLGVQHFMGDTRLFQHTGKQLGVFDGRGSHQYRLPLLHAFLNVFKDGLVLFLYRQVDQIAEIFADIEDIGWNHDDFEVVNLLKLESLGVCRAGHAGKFGIKPEIVLEGDRSQGLVFILDRHTLFGFHRLVQTFRPTPPGHRTTRELIHNDDLIIANDIVHIPLEQHIGAQTSIDVVHQSDVHCIVKALT